MRRKNRWNETREALAGIAKYAWDHKSGEIDLKFLNSNDRAARVKVRTIHKRCTVPRFDHSR